MLHTAERANRSVDARMLAAADRLFVDFADLPVMTVIRAFTAARSALRMQGLAPTPEDVEAHARMTLHEHAMSVA